MYKNNVFTDPSIILEMLFVLKLVTYLVITFCHKKRFTGIKLLLFIPNTDRLQEVDDYV